MPLITELPNVREVVDAKQERFGLIMLPSSFEGVLELRTMRNKKMYNNLHFLAIFEEFEDECSENHCFLFSLKTSRLRNV